MNLLGTFFSSQLISMQFEKRDINVIGRTQIGIIQKRDSNGTKVTVASRQTKAIYPFHNRHMKL